MNLICSTTLVIRLPSLKLRRALVGPAYRQAGPPNPGGIMLRAILYALIVCEWYFNYFYELFLYSRNVSFLQG